MMNWEPYVLHSQYIGAISGDDAVSYLTTMSADSRFDNLKYIIADWSESDPSGLTEDDALRMAAHIGLLGEINPNIVQITALPPEGFPYGLSSLYLSMIEGFHWTFVKVDSVSEARDVIANSVE